jgi:hypothetical protein
MIYGQTRILGNLENRWWFVIWKCSDLDTKPKVNNYITEMEHLIFQVLYLHAQSYVHMYTLQTFTIHRFHYVGIQT